MSVVKRHIACLVTAAALVTVSAQTAPAASVILQNDTQQGIKAVYCLDGNGNATQVSGAVAAGKSVSVLQDKLPDQCDRLALLLDNGASRQFALDAAPGGAEKIIFSMDPLNVNSEETYPSMLVESEEDAFASPAGGRLTVLLQLLQSGMDSAKWVSFAWPLPDAREKSELFVVALAGQSWSLSGQGIVFKELIQGRQLAESVTVAAPFSNATVMDVFDELKALQCVPRMMEYNGVVGVTTEKGKVLDPGAGDAQGAGDDDLWQAVTDQMERVADGDGGTVLIMFGNKDTRFDLTLDLDAAKATLVISRKPGAPFA
ncbi:MAG: hypothetical protein LBJ14_06590 [Desulfarculales bacterium]|jgi:hypothetical protein|nr:hypothetical protein [Desulfarculales bacterium]